MYHVRLLVFFIVVTLPNTYCDDMYNAPIDMRNFFPELEGDMTKVTWAHRCNSRAELEAALSNKDVMMIEADIIPGTLVGGGGGPPIPIMGHPPDTTGDLSLEQFLDLVLQSRSGKGIKLDFKSIEYFKASENIVEQFLAKAEVDFPVWVNADIVKGPGADSVKAEPVEPNYFLQTCMEKFPVAMISPGWVVNVKSAETLKYNTTHIDEMTSLLAENNIVHPVTFPVHAGIASNSVDALSNLIHSSVDGTSLTLWCGTGEWVDYDKLRELIETVGDDKVFIDMPPEMKEKLFSASPRSCGVSYSVPASLVGTVVAALFLLW